MPRYTLPCLLLMACALAGGASAADPAPPAASAHMLLSKDLLAAAGKELILLSVEYLPGGASLPHRHDAQVFVYVLDGELLMQVKGGAPQTLHAGDTFYESPQDVHVVSRNASAQAPARMLVFMVKDKDAPVSRPAG